MGADAVFVKDAGNRLLGSAFRNGDKEKGRGFAGKHFEDQFWVGIGDEAVSARLDAMVVVVEPGGEAEKKDRVDDFLFLERIANLCYGHFWFHYYFPFRSGIGRRELFRTGCEKQRGDR